MKIQRPGNTESHLLFCQYLKSNHPSLYDIDSEYLYIDWLYKTTGLYDKSVSLNNKPQIIQSNLYNRWLHDYSNSLHACEHIEFYFGCPTNADIAPDLFYQYVQSYDTPSLSINSHIIKSTQAAWYGYWHEESITDNMYHGVFAKHYEFIKGKKVLVVSPFAALIKYQFQHAVYEIFKDFPDFELKIYAPPYTFLNHGPHDHFYQTLEMMYEDISKIDFDVALLSCGTYATLLIDLIEILLHKDAIYMGRGGNRMFGIGTTEKYPDADSKSQLWITQIPQCLIYPYAKRVEEGIYWYPTGN